MRSRGGRLLRLPKPPLTAGWITTTTTAASGIWRSYPLTNITTTSPQVSTPPVCCRYGSNENVLDLGSTLEMARKYRTGPDRIFPVWPCIFLPYLPHLLADDPTDGVCGILLHLGRGVSVGVQREPRRVVAQGTGQRFHIHAAFQRQRCEGVAQIVKTDVLRADGLQNFIAMESREKR